MATWLNRVGRNGEHQKEFLDTSRIYLTWNVIQDEDLGHVKSFQELRSLVSKAMPRASVETVSNHASQMFNFVTKMKPGDLVVAPLFDRAAVASTPTAHSCTAIRERFVGVVRMCSGRALIPIFGTA